MQLQNQYSQQNFDNAIQIEIQIFALKKQLKKPQYQKFYDIEKEKYIDFANYILQLEEQKNQMLFDIRQATGDGNYTDPATWNITEIYDYLQRKKEQIKRIKNER